MQQAQLHRLQLNEAEEVLVEEGRERQQDLRMRQEQQEIKELGLVDAHRQRRIAARKAGSRGGSRGGSREEAEDLRRREQQQALPQQEVRLQQQQDQEELDAPPKDLQQHSDGGSDKENEPPRGLEEGGRRSAKLAQHTGIEEDEALPGASNTVA